MNKTLPLGAPIVGSAIVPTVPLGSSPVSLNKIIRRARLMRRLASLCAGSVGGLQASGGVFLLALLFTGWLNPQRVDAIILFASLACAALLGACLFSIAYWFLNLRS